MKRGNHDTVQRTTVPHPGGSALCVSFQRVFRMDPAGHCLASRKIVRVAIGPGEEDSALIRQA